MLILKCFSCCSSGYGDASGLYISFILCQGNAAGVLGSLALSVTKVTEVTKVTDFNQINAKNQDNLKINETDNTNPQNTTKNEGLNPQKTVTSVTSVTDKTNDPNQNNQVHDIADMYKSEASPYPEEKQLHNFFIITTKDDKKIYKCGQCQKVFADLDQARAHICGGQGA